MNSIVGCCIIFQSCSSASEYDLTRGKVDDCRNEEDEIREEKRQITRALRRLVPTSSAKCQSLYPERMVELNRSLVLRWSPVLCVQRVPNVTTPYS